MYLRTATRSVSKRKDEMVAVKVLLDCANTTTIKNYELKKRRELEVLCPWTGKKEPDHLVPPPNSGGRSEV